MRGSHGRHPYFCSVVHHFHFVLFLFFSCYFKICCRLLLSVEHCLNIWFHILPFVPHGSELDIVNMFHVFFPHLHLRSFLWLDEKFAGILSILFLTSKIFCLISIDNSILLGSKYSTIWSLVYTISPPLLLCCPVKHLSAAFFTCLLIRFLNLLRGISLSSSMVFSIPILSCSVE